MVALRDQQQWAAGLEQHQAVFDGHLYWFTDARQRAVFAASPEGYAPALGGDCIVTYAETGRRVSGDPQYGLLHQRRLYFFAGQNERDRFTANSARYSDADLANDGYCVVSKVDQQRLVKGLPETVAIVNGMRYHFFGAKPRAIFVANMQRYGVELPMSSESSSAQGSELARPSLDKNSSLNNQDQAATPKNSLRSNAVGSSNSPLKASEPAMGGYSPVSIRDAGQWILGDSKHQVEFDGEVYLIADEQQQALFLENPARYLPALGGDCVVTLVDDKLRVPGSVYFPAYYPSQENGRLYLFATAEQKDAFKANPTNYADADLAWEGNCAVSQVDEGKTIAGLPDLVVWRHGKRYFFATRELQQKFLANPEAYIEPEETEQQ